MGLQKLILGLALWITDLFTFFIKTDKNRITFVSLTQDTLTSDFKLLADALEQENKYDIHYNLIRFENDNKGKINYFFNCLHQLVEYKKSRLVIINDNNFVISTHKPKNCQVLQIWHACGAVKKFGNEIKRKYPIQNYDYVICNAEYWKSVYSRSFGVPENHILVTGMPRTDDLLKTKSDAFYEKHPECRGKKLCLYAPTFRGNIMDGFRVDHFDMKQVEKELPDWIILYKFHPLLGDIQLEGCNAINVNKEDLYTLMQASDCLISDYSSVVFDYSLLNKPWIEYISDLNEYSKTIGLNIDLKDIPGSICTNEEELIQAIKNLNSYDYEKNQSFQQKYMTFTDGKNTERVIEQIDKIMTL